jgi:D-alanyl-lipoteichoic acid acyltransferase DltB (MBOAT superfamily)
VLFNSFEFIFLFLPICLAGYFLLAKYSTVESALGFLVLASLFFYAYWKPIYLVLILFSILFNYLLGRLLSRPQSKYRFAALIFGVTTNLALLGYFKYANFFVDNINVLFAANWHLDHIFLPLAISFFTFQQISYLVDAWQGKTSEYNFLHYTLFVCFFPQLIAGPIVHHKEILPQFMARENMSPKLSNFAIGLSIFAIGLFKKTVIADSLSSYVGPVYDGGDPAASLDFFKAWGATLAYTFQLYFDFSGYSDMAVGCARMFGVVLPVNFFSPYKSTSIIEFWRRWHITLSRFLRDYLYIALGGSRHGSHRRYTNLFLTMLLGGLWHGAGWTFVVWGALHGAFLIVNHGWRNLISRAGSAISASRLYSLASWLLTFTAVVFSWVYFRAPTIEKANQIASAMLGMGGFELPAGIVVRMGELGGLLQSAGVALVDGGGALLVGNYLWVVCAAFLALCMPNVAQVFSRYSPVLYENDKIFHDLRSSPMVSWDCNWRWALLVSCALVAGVLTLLQVSEFLYFQF